MRPEVTIMCSTLVELMSKAFENPETERKYQEWLREKEVRGAATNESRALAQ